MPKNIQLKDEVYARLESVRGKRETFSETVELLLSLREKITELVSVLEGQIKFHEWQKQKADEASRALKSED